MGEALVRALRLALRVVDAKTLPPPHRVVLTHLAAEAGEDDQVALSAAAVAAVTGHSARAVQSYLTELRKAEWIAGERPQGLTPRWTVRTAGQAIARKPTNPRRTFRGGMNTVQRGYEHRSEAPDHSEMRRKTPAEVALLAEYPHVFNDTEAESSTDAVALAAARVALRPDNVVGWALWRTMRSIPILVAGEAADEAVAPGSLARQASGLAERLRGARLGLDVGLNLLVLLALALTTERTVAGPGWRPPTMATTSLRFTALCNDFARTTSAPASGQRKRA